MLRHAFASPKLAALARKLGIERCHAVGVLEHLWYFTATQAPRGDVGRWTDEEIAAGIDWRGSPSDLVAALVSTRWLDACPGHRLLVHDWSEHCDQTVKRCPQVQKSGFAQLQTSEPLVSHQRAAPEPGIHTSGAQDSLSLSLSPEPEPVPEPEKKPRAVRAVTSDAGKLGGMAVAAYIDLYRKKRGADVALNGQERKQLKQIAEALGSEERFRATLERWFRRLPKDTRGWNVGLFYLNRQECWAEAQEERAMEAARADMEAAAKATDEATAGQDFDEIFKRAGVK